MWSLLFIFGVVKGKYIVPCTNNTTTTNTTTTTTTTNSNNNNNNNTLNFVFGCK
jgi:hypothetical protein